MSFVSSNQSTIFCYVGGSILLIVLNTNYWSVSSYKRNTNVTIIGDIQLAWLRDQLRSAKQKDQKVLISGHIPPG